MAQDTLDLLEQFFIETDLKSACKVSQISFKFEKSDFSSRERLGRIDTESEQHADGMWDIVITISEVFGEAPIFVMKSLVRVIYNGISKGDIEPSDDVRDFLNRKYYENLV